MNKLEPVMEPELVLLMVHSTDIRWEIMTVPMLGYWLVQKMALQMDLMLVKMGDQSEFESDHLLEIRLAQSDFYNLTQLMQCNMDN